MCGHLGVEDDVDMLVVEFVHVLIQPLSVKSPVAHVEHKVLAKSAEKQLCRKLERRRHTFNAAVKWQLDAHHVILKCKQWDKQNIVDR